MGDARLDIPGWLCRAILPDTPSPGRQHYISKWWDVDKVDGANVSADVAKSVCHCEIQ